jgi:hypothetical protein
VLLDGEKVDYLVEEGCAAGREINALLGGWRAVLLGGREVDCKVKKGCAPWWGKGGLLGGRGLCC